MTEPMGTQPAMADCYCQICRPETDYDAMERRCIDTVLRHGWQVMLISDDADCCSPAHDAGEGHEHHDHDDPEPAFAYTIGLGHRTGHPELLVSGLEPGLMHRALNAVARRVLAGRRYRPGDVLEDVLGRVPVVLERVADDALRETVTWSGWFHRRQPEALMVVWPTTGGIFAWQPGAPESLDRLQPRAWRDPILHTGGVAPDPAWVLPAPPDHLALTCAHVLDQGAPVGLVARQTGYPDEDDGEYWTLHCGSEHSEEEMVIGHLAHLVRGAPSVRALADLDLDRVATRRDVDAPWERAAIDPAELKE